MIKVCEIIKRQKFYLENGSHPSDSILIVLEGKFFCQIEDQKYIAEKNNVFVFKKRVKFDRKILSPLKAIYIIFDCLPDFQSGLLSTAHLSRTTENIELLLKSIANGNSDKTEHYINDILFTHTHIKIRKNNNSVAKKCALYFENNYGNSISLDSLANDLFVSKQGLIKNFKSCYNQTPISYLNNLRLKKSRVLLQSTEKSVSEISEICGYENVYYFSNCFKKTFGMSPTAYRDSLRL